jgi:hypothetical protein
MRIAVVEVTWTEGLNVGVLLGRLDLGLRDARLEGGDEGVDGLLVAGRLDAFLDGAFFASLWCVFLLRTYPR